jgi:hypothetical protein
VSNIWRSDVFRVVDGPGSTSGGRLVGIVRLRTEGHGVSEMDQGVNKIT